MTVTRPFNNDYVTVTIPAGNVASGWQDDGVVVRLITVTDRVVIGETTSVGTEKLRVLNAAGVAIRCEGREDHPNTSVAAAASEPRRRLARACRTRLDSP